MDIFLASLLSTVNMYMSNLVVVIVSHEQLLSISLLHDFEEAREREAIIRKLESGKPEIRFLSNSSLEFCKRFLQVEKRLKIFRFIGIEDEK